MQTDHTLHVGNDGETEFLLTTWDDGEMELAVRPLVTAPTWSPPEPLTGRPALTLLTGGAA